MSVTCGSTGSVSRPTDATNVAELVELFSAADGMLVGSISSLRLARSVRRLGGRGRGRRRSSQVDDCEAPGQFEDFLFRFAKNNVGNLEIL